MREIKFRIRLKAKEDFGTLKQGEILTMIAPVFDKANGLAFWSIDKVWEFLSADEYTGLKDKNGKEIYEGDLVSRGAGFNWKVEFKEGSWIASGEVLWLDYNQFNQCEVIGNIYQNPELP